MSIFVIVLVTKKLPSHTEDKTSAVLTQLVSFCEFNVWKDWQIFIHKSYVFLVIRNITNLQIEILRK